jgi:hypothetical protein
MHHTSGVRVTPLTPAEIAMASGQSRRSRADLERFRVPLPLVGLGLVAAANVAAVALSLLVA